MFLVGINSEVFLLLLFTIFLVLYDRAFPKRIRIEFLVALIGCCMLTIFGREFFEKTAAPDGTWSPILIAVAIIVRASVMGLLADVTITDSKIARRVLIVPVLVDIVFVAVGLQAYCLHVETLYALYIFAILLYKSRKREWSDIVFATLLLAMFAAAVFVEDTTGDPLKANEYLSGIVCIYYFYLVMRIYKKDRLTGLLVRHNLIFEMEDNLKRTYDMVLIDVDNFKLINDKYGHDKGDEVLVTIVTKTLKHLPKGCLMYRYGGDEFVIISRKVSTETLVAALEDTNTELAEDDYRMSYGVATHMPGVDSMITLSEADKAMYENKRLIKSEDIWDDMTGLYNMRGFIDELNSFRRSLNKEGRMVCLVGVDVERLSNINKTYGYGEGNLIIAVLAKVLKSCLRGRDFIGHLGSDEFAVALECDCEGDEIISAFIEQLQESMDNSFELSSKEYSIKLNIDEYYIPANDAGASEDHLNGLLYIKQEDKDNRRKNTLSENAEEYDEKEDALVMDILDNNKLSYAFQPIISAKTGDIIAYESLMRSKTEPMISPIKIIKYAERHGRLDDIEKLTVFNTMAKFANSQDIPSDAKVFLNSIAGHFLSDDEYDIMRLQFGHLFKRLVVEITEIRELDDDALAVLNTRRDKHGFSLAIDDYGSGVSNTNNLLRYMPQIVKIDRLLITGIDRNAKKQFFVNSIISFAKENSMQTLAEGVETESELKTLIKLGVDMIQGYVVAKPSVDIIKETPEDIKKLVVSTNMKVGTKSRMIYTANEYCELSVVQLAMEDYTCINVASRDIKIAGSTEYTADLIIRVSDNLDCNMTMTDVFLNSVDDRPCIELGENTNLTIDLQGTNKLNATGIHVPESSSLTISGPGSLQIFVKGSECYAIGADAQSPFGRIHLKSSGLITINVDGEQCVGIGGGIATENSEIAMTSGTLNLSFATVKAVGIGAYSGDVKIRFKDSDMIAVYRVGEGTIIGTLDGRQDIDIMNFSIEMTGSGSEISVMGCPGENTGDIRLTSGSVKCKFSGHIVNIFGGESGDLNLKISHCSLSILGEGDYITAFGTRTEDATLSITECSVDLTINASTPLPLGARERRIENIGPNKAFKINGVEGEITDY